MHALRISLAAPQLFEVQRRGATQVEEILHPLNFSTQYRLLTTALPRRPSNGVVGANCERGMEWFGGSELNFPSILLCMIDF